MNYGEHFSVQKEDILNLLKSNFSLEGEYNFSDLTFGAGGHTLAIAELFPKSHIYSFDQDPDALSNGQKILKENSLEERVTLIDSNFENFSKKIPLNVKLDAVLLDAGVSSHQFDTGERGFSFRFEGPLDMRMNPNAETPNAADILATYSLGELQELFSLYGEEKFSKTIAKNIVEKRTQEPILTTKQLEDICFHSYPKKLRFGKISPATKVFQALRIKVNRELDVLSDVIGQVIPRLNCNGLFMIISFHSLEDRIVKHSFKSWKDDAYPIEVLTKKPILPSSDEIFKNSRSRSAKLRVIKKVNEWPSKNKYAKKE